MSKSLIYRNIYLYRLLMNVLYLGRYRQRFKKIVSLLVKNTTSVTELCFGDVYIAQYCSENNIRWVGYDLNERFVSYAQKNKFNALHKDIILMDEFPKCDTCIMIGSLYHFKEQSVDVLKKMLRSSKQVIISEPVRNLSDSKGLIGYIAKKSANAGKGEEHFRYNVDTFIELINQLNVNYKVVSIDKDILINISND